MNQNHISQQFKISSSSIVILVSFLVGLYGFFITISTLLDEIELFHLKFLNSFAIDIHILLGMGLVYLSILLSRRKRNALIVALAIFIFILGEGVTTILNHHQRLDRLNLIVLVRYILLPIIITVTLLLSKNSFRVKSDLMAFRNSFKLAVIVLLITLIYGIAGFMLLGKTDFHRSISFVSAFHHTIDQFDLTTNYPLHPYTKRANLFMDSLSFISIISIAYLVLSLFSPVRARLIDQSADREKIKKIIDRYGAPSEDYFKLWPHDKHYFFSSTGDAAIAYNVRRGVALILADPVGNKASYSKLFSEFSETCWANDWQPALIHIDERYENFYKDNGYQLQLIGQEAIVDIDHFVNVTAKNKYFRNIKNRFNRENYSIEILEPPHHQALVDRLKYISDNWLEKPGRSERGFVMGYFSEEYLQQCQIVVARDAAKTIQAFMNIVPSFSFNQEEATYDMLRGVKDAPPNINDFLLYQLLFLLHEKKFKKFSLGLCPLVGLDESNEENSLISSVLRFAYVNGDRIYSFSGLHRFKDKYEPTWSNRYLAYKGGVRGFSKMLNALLLAMKVRN